MRSTGPDLATRQLVKERDYGLCRRCGLPGNNLHHRIGRGMGGSRRTDINNPAALVTLCGSGTTGCHGYITEHPSYAYEFGWCIRRSDPEPPETVPMVDLYGNPFFLNDQGGVIYMYQDKLKRGTRNEQATT